MPVKKVAFMLLVPVLVAVATVCAAGTTPKQVQLSPQVNAGLVYLLSFADPDPDDRPARFDPYRIEPVLDFLLAAKPEGNLYTPDKIQSAPAAYMEGLFAVDLKRILALAYNPRIPSVFTAPTSVRMTQWRKINGRRQSLPDLQHMLDDLAAPVILTGVEYIQNTPDTFSGAYYDYELDRAIILSKHTGRNILVSVSSQRGKSGVGKKGYILGRDHNLDYIYTGQPGLNMTGLGWVRSYMYDSHAVAVYCQTDSDRPAVKVGFFKWVRAGWANLNIVRSDHIHSGLRRFLPIYKNILESSQTTDIKTIESIWQALNTLTDDQLRQATSAHFKHVAEYYADPSGSTGRVIQDTLLEPDYIDNFDRLEMQSLLLVEYAKELLGLAVHTEVGRLLPD